MGSEDEKKYKRRVHYSGKYPKKFEEKYKEHNPEKYQDIAQHVIAKGSTPAGMHISIMVNEILDFLQIKPGQRGLDCTLGYGGHTRKMLECLQGEGCIYGLDVDPIESEKTVARLRDAGYGEDIFQFRLMNFADIDKMSEEAGKFDFVLADLGVSSMQIDNPERGFSYKVDGPLDLRLDPSHGESAAERLRNISRDEFVGMLIENSDEPYAEEIADKVFDLMRKGKTINTTTELRQAIEDALWKIPCESKDNKKINKSNDKTNNKSNNKINNKTNNTTNNNEEKNKVIKKSCARVFQALRIDVNSEFEVLYAFLEKLPGILKPGGRVAILTFHSGEDRLVKKAFKDLYKSGVFSEISADVLRPSAEECKLNPRSKSTKMRYAVKS